VNRTLLEIEIRFPLRFFDEKISNRSRRHSMHFVTNAVGNSGLSARAATANAFNIKTGAVYFSHSTEN